MALPSLCQVACTAFVLLGHAIGAAAQANITDDTFFYGQSPPVYPSRKYHVPG
jgi:hypothetical protein